MQAACIEHGDMTGAMIYRQGIESIEQWLGELSEGKIRSCSDAHQRSEDITSVQRAARPTLHRKRNNGSA
jgi:hypothetical protein